MSTTTRIRPATRKVPTASGDPNEHGDESGHGPVNPGKPAIQALPEITLQLGPRLDPSLKPPPPPDIQAALDAASVPAIQAQLRALLGFPEVRYEGVGPAVVLSEWLTASRGNFGAWQRPFSGTEEAVARDNFLRNFKLLSDGEVAGAFGALAFGVSIPIGYIERGANLALEEVGRSYEIGEHTTARLDRIEVRPGPTSSTLDTTIHGVLLRDGIRRNYKFKLTIRDTLIVETRALGSRAAGVITTRSAVIDAGIDGAAGVVLRVFNQALAFTQTGFIAMAIVKTIMRVLGLYIGLRAPQGEDYLNSAIKLGLVDGDVFTGVGAIAAALLPRQHMLSPEDGEPVPVPGKKLVFDIGDVDVTSAALQLKGKS